MAKPKQKTVGLLPKTHRKWEKIKAIRKWTYQDFADISADRELSLIESESTASREPVPN